MTTFEKNWAVSIITNKAAWTDGFLFQKTGALFNGRYGRERWPGHDVA
jgi:hypothetical protein